MCYQFTDFVYSISKVIPCLWSRLASSVSTKCGLLLISRHSWKLTYKHKTLPTSHLTANVLYNNPDIYLDGFNPFQGPFTLWKLPNNCHFNCHGNTNSRHDKLLWGTQTFVSPLYAFKGQCVCCWLYCLFTFSVNSKHLYIYYLYIHDYSVHTIIYPIITVLQ